MSGAPIEVGELARMLDARAADLAPELLPNGRREGAYWASGNIADDRGSSLKVNLSGPHQGWWTDFSLSRGERGHSGDMLKLVALVRFGGELRDAIAWAKSTLGLDGLNPGRLATVRAEASQRAQDAEREAIAQAERRRRVAHGLFIGGASIVDTPAEIYLAGRGIDLSLLGRAPNALRFNPLVWCEEAGKQLPAMLAAIVDEAGIHVGTHRTWIEPDDESGLWRKALLDTPKKALGGFLGGFIPLWKGADRNPLPRIAAGTPIAVSEGIEDGLTVACACPELRVVASVSLSNIGNLPVPAQAGPVTIVGQRDAPGSPAARALQAVVQQLQARGATVRVAMPPEGVKDANDLARGAAA